MNKYETKSRNEADPGAEGNNDVICFHLDVDDTFTNQDEVIDDWSAHLSSGFGHHNQIIIPLQRTAISCMGEDINDNCLRIYCVESLTPMDMIDLWNGKNDATGNKIWLGALFFIEAFIRPILDEDVSDNETSTNKYASWLRQWRETLFKERTVLELGCGE